MECFKLDFILNFLGFVLLDFWNRCIHLTSQKSVAYSLSPILSSLSLAAEGRGQRAETRERERQREKAVHYELAEEAEPSDLIYLSLIYRK